MLVSCLQTTSLPLACSPARHSLLFAPFPPSSSRLPCRLVFFSPFVASSAAACVFASIHLQALTLLFKTSRPGFTSPKKKGTKKKIRSAPENTLLLQLPAGSRCLVARSTVSPAGSQIISPPSSTLIWYGAPRRTEKEAEKQTKPSQQKTAKKQAKKDNDGPASLPFVLQFS